MLSIKSNFGIFKDRQGQTYSEDDLNKLCKTLIRSDCVNFDVKKVGGGFNSAISDRIFNKIANKDENAKILIFNDFSLQMLNRLIDEGFKRENVCLAYGSWNKDGTPSDNEYVLKIMRLYIKSNFVGDFNTISLKEVFENMKFDVIIANPPYGSIGAKITNHIRENVDYGEFVNLLPANDYKRIDGFWNYVSEMETMDRFIFEDASVTTTAAKVSKIKSNTSSEFEFILSGKNLKLLKKYFYRNAELDKLGSYELPIRRRNFNGMAKKFPVAIAHRDLAHGHLPYSRETAEYRFNNGELTIDEYEKLVAETLKGKPTGNLTSDPIFFKTKSEAANYKNFIYSIDGFRFTAMIWTAFRTDSSSGYEECFPRVDWTHPWTVEEILREYDYTESEIKEVMEDLKNYKGMND